MHPDITMRVAHERAQDRLRAAESERAARALRRRTRHPAADAGVALRLDRATDEAAVGRLAELNMRRLPDGPFVVGEVAGVVVAALPLAGGAVLVDPFVPTAHVTPLLELRAAQIRRAGVEPRRRFGLRLRRA